MDTLLISRKKITVFTRGYLENVFRCLLRMNKIITFVNVFVLLRKLGFEYLMCCMLSLGHNIPKLILTLSWMCRKEECPAGPRNLSSAHLLAPGEELHQGHL